MSIIFNLICVNWEKSLTFLLQLILYGLGLERTLHSKYTSSPSLIFDPLSEKPRLRMAWGTSKRVTNSIFTSMCWIIIIFLQVIESFQPSSKLPSPVCWSAARQPRNFPASFMVGIKTNVLRVTFPSGLVWKVRLKEKWMLCKNKSYMSCDIISYLWSSPPPGHFRRWSCSNNLAFGFKSFASWHWLSSVDHIYTQRTN